MIEPFRNCVSGQTCGDGDAGLGRGHHDFAQAFPHVAEAVCQGQDGHDLAGHCDVKLGLPGLPFLGGGLTHGDLPQKPVEG